MKCQVLAMQMSFKFTNRLLSGLRKEISILAHAFVLYSRIRIPVFNYSIDIASDAICYFPLVGLFLSIISSVIFIASTYVLPYGVSIILMLLCMTILTGAMHEDGLADSVDAFFGGMTKEKILEIMKDSRIGTYGTLSLIFGFSLKFVTFFNIPTNTIPIIFIIAQCCSRIMPVALVFSSHYIQGDNSKSFYLNTAFSPWKFIWPFLCGFAPLFIFNYKFALIIILFFSVELIFFRRYTIRRIGGYTGDVLGALQQISEFTFYIIYLSLCSRYIFL